MYRFTWYILVNNYQGNTSVQWCLVEAAIHQYHIIRSIKDNSISLYKSVNYVYDQTFKEIHNI